MFVGPLILLAILKTFFFMPFVVEGDSMLPGLKSDDVFFVDLLTYRAVEPARDDVVVFFLDEDPKYFYVKRIIGLPGDKIHLEKDGVDLVDARGAKQRLVEPFLMPDPHPSERFLSDANQLGQDFTVSAGRYFMMGDNRAHSRDSRYFNDPFVPRTNIVGKFGIGLGNLDDWFGAGSNQNGAHDSQQVGAQHLSMGKLNFYGRLTPSPIANFNVQVADDEQERDIGLMHRVGMLSDEGMIFFFDSAQPRNFWMKNTLIPLDMIFLDESWRVVSIQKNAQPCKADPCGLYPSFGAAKYVLEINGGLSDKLHIEVGDSAQLTITNH